MSTNVNEQKGTYSTVKKIFTRKDKDKADSDDENKLKQTSEIKQEQIQDEDFPLQQTHPKAQQETIIEIQSCLSTDGRRKILPFFAGYSILCRV